MLVSSNRQSQKKPSFSVQTSPSSSPVPSPMNSPSRRLSSIRCRSGNVLGNRFDKRMPAASVDSAGCRNCRLPLQHTKEKVDVCGPILPLIHPGADSWVEGWQPECSQYGLPRITSSSVHLEEPVFDVHDMRDVQQDVLEQERSYREHFLARTHINYCAHDDSIGPIVMSVRYEEGLPEMEEARFRLVVRTPSATVCRLYPAETYGDDPQVEDLARTTLVDLPSSVRFQCSVSSDLQNAILEYDEHTKQSRFKFGILIQAAGQCTEEAIFSNNTLSDEFSKFLNCIATEVDLQGFDGFRGGLDVKSNLSGKKSYHAKIDNSEIMFHVSPLMPFSVTDSQQVARKRHIGNDIVCVVFQEDATTFDPTWIASSFLHTYVVVQPVGGSPSSPSSIDTTSEGTLGRSSQTYYRISVCSKKSVPPFSPFVPSTGVFPLGEEFRSFFLTLLINAERSSTKAEQFAKLERRTREHLLKDLYQAVQSSCEVADAPAEPTTSSKEGGGRWSGVRKLIPKKQKGVPSSGSRHSVTSQASTHSSSTEPFARPDGKGLLHFFRGNSMHSLNRGGRSRGVSAPIFTRERSASACVVCPADKPTTELVVGQGGTPCNFISVLTDQHDGLLRRSSQVISDKDVRRLSVNDSPSSCSPATYEETFLESPENGQNCIITNDTSLENVVSSVEGLRRTVVALREERMQLLRDDVTMKARLAEYQVRESEQQRELLAAKAEIARLRAQMALLSLHSADKLSVGNTTSNSCAVTIQERRSESMRV